MSTLSRHFVSGLATASLALLTAACAPQSGKPGLTGDSASPSLAPRPHDVTSERAQLLRYRGQTSFLNPVNRWWGHGMPEAASRASAKSDSAEGGRAEQESDVFKVGKPGSKLLFLLNNSRGLQVVSFKDGAENPKLIGRVAPTGQYPNEMYYDEARDRLIVMENGYNQQSQRYESRLVIYDVANPEKPSIAATHSLEGHVADSRIVGDVLYVALQVENKGRVLSLSLAKKKSLEQVAVRDLEMPVSSAQNMNIQSVEKNGKMKYYLLATLSESGWGWFDRQSRIEVIDISDAKGAIAPVMSVAAKGFVRERSQTLIKNDTLIVTSNYFTGPDRRSVARIAVETFRFPNKETQVITENEALRRKLNIEHKLGNLTGQQRDALLEQLVSDAAEGIKGRLIKTAKGDLQKMMADSAVTVGDGSGLSANLQDVRYDGDLLYAFWVPANEIDPFDLFDISEPQNGVKYINRLHFDGWIAKAIPLSIGGRKFVIGLGFVVPVVNNESNRRQPQAMIFEIVKAHGKLRPVDVAQLTFEGSNIWSNFNGQDKEIEVRVDGEGKGEILFQASRSGAKGWETGGQTLRFDIGKVLAGQGDQALKQGPFLSGGSEWIKRVFTNKEIERINSFSDRKLATFGQRDGDVSTLSPVSILELARQLRGYDVIRTASGSFGVQIISDYYGSDRNETVLRLVSINRADEEKAGVLAETKVSGSYVSHLIDTTGALLVMTTEYKNVATVEGQHDYRTFVKVARVNVLGKALKVERETQWTNKTEEEEASAAPAPAARAASMVMRRPRPFYNNSQGLVRLAGSKIIAQSDSSLYLIDSGISALAATRVKLSDSCKVQSEGRSEVHVQILGDKAYLASKQVIESKEFEGLQFSKNFLAKLAIEGTEGKCSDDTNIPGRAIAVTPAGGIMVDDQWVKDIVEVKQKPEEKQEQEQGDEPQPVSGRRPMPPWRPRQEKFEMVTKQALVSLKQQGSVATLADEAENASAVASAIESEPGMFARIVKNSGWGAASHTLEFLSLDADGRLQTETFALGLTMEDEAQLVKVVNHPGVRGLQVALVRSGSKVQAIQWSRAGRRPEVRKLAKMNESFELEEAKDLVTLPQSYDYGVQGPNFTPEKLSFEFVQGLTGITQVVLQ